MFLHVSSHSELTTIPQGEAEAGGGAVSAVWGQRLEVLRMRP